MRIFIALTTSTQLSTARCYRKLEPLASLLRVEFQAYVALGQNVSFNEMIVPFAWRSKHTLKIKNRSVKESFKI
jgi:hypothetical protein